MTNHHGTPSASEALYMAHRHSQPCLKISSNARTWSEACGCMTGPASRWQRARSRSDSALARDVSTSASRKSAHDTSLTGVATRYSVLAKNWRVSWAHETIPSLTLPFGELNLTG